MTRPSTTFESIADDIRNRMMEKRRYDERARLSALFEKYSDNDLRRLWDEYDGFNTPDGFCGEDIHNEMNRRGNGENCAV